MRSRSANLVAGALVFASACSSDSPAREVPSMPPRPSQPSAATAGTRADDVAPVVPRPGGAWDTDVRPGNPPCSSVAEPVELSTQTSLGFSAADVMGELAGPFEADLEWTQRDA